MRLYHRSRQWFIVEKKIIRNGFYNYVINSLRDSFAKHINRTIQVARKKNSIATFKGILKVK